MSSRVLHTEASARKPFMGQQAPTWFSHSNQSITVRSVAIFRTWLSPRLNFFFLNKVQGQLDQAVGRKEIKGPLSKCLLHCSRLFPSLWCRSSFYTAKRTISTDYDPKFWSPCGKAVVLNAVIDVRAFCKGGPPENSWGIVNIFGTEVSWMILLHNRIADKGLGCTGARVYYEEVCGRGNFYGPGRVVNCNM